MVGEKMTSFNQHSLYSNTDVNNGYRDYYNPIEIGYDSSDIFIIVTSEYHQRPGGLAQFLYGDPRLSWVFSYFNREVISDIIFDLQTGMILRVPCKERLLSYF